MHAPAVPPAATPTVLDYIAEQSAALRAATAPLAPATVDALAGIGASIGRMRLIGSGTSSHAARVIAASARDRLGLEVSVDLPSDAVHLLGDGAYGPGVLVVAISQSGRSTRTRAALQRARALGSPTVLVTGEPVDAGVADAVVDLRCGPEQVGAKTKGYTATIATLESIVAALAGTAADAALARVPEAVAETLARADAPVRAFTRTLVDDERSLAVLGSGPYLGVAHEGALKITETALVPVESFDIEEYLHGPHRRLGAEVALAMVAAGPLGARALDLADYAGAVGAPSLVIAAPELADRAADAGHLVVPLPPDLPDRLAAIPAVVPLQLLSARFALARGLAPEALVHPDFHDRMSSKDPA